MIMEAYSSAGVSRTPTTSLWFCPFFDPALDNINLFWCEWSALWGHKHVVTFVQSQHFMEVAIGYISCRDNRVIQIPLHDQFVGIQSEPRFGLNGSSVFIVRLLVATKATVFQDR